MRYYRTPEEQQKDTQSRIESYRQAAAQAPAIIRVLRQFNGKVYNCKLDKALADATENKIRVSERYGYCEIYATHTTNYDHITLARFDKAKLENKRLDAGKLIEQVTASREELLKKAYTIETTAPQADNIREYIRQEIDRLENICKGLPDDIRDIYNIPYSIRTY